MGWNTTWLTKALEEAKKAGDSEEVARLRSLIHGVQGRCRHNGPRRLNTLDRDSKSGKYKAGGRVEFCLLCSRIVAYETPEQLDAQERDG